MRMPRPRAAHAMQYSMISFTALEGVSRYRLIAVVRVRRYVAPGMDMRGWLMNWAIGASELRLSYRARKSSRGTMLGNDSGDGLRGVRRLPAGCVVEAPPRLAADGLV